MCFYLLFTYIKHTRAADLTYSDRMTDVDLYTGNLMPVSLAVIHLHTATSGQCGRLF